MLSSRNTYLQKLLLIPQNYFIVHLLKHSFALQSLIYADAEMPTNSTVSTTVSMLVSLPPRKRERYEAHCIQHAARKECKYESIMPNNTDFLKLYFSLKASLEVSHFLSGKPTKLTHFPPLSGDFGFPSDDWQGWPHCSRASARAFLPCHACPPWSSPLCIHLEMQTQGHCIGPAPWKALLTPLENLQSSFRARLQLRNFRLN